MEMKYLFDMGEVWHVYSDVGNQWIYQRLEQTGEEILEKSGDNLPGPLGRLDLLKKLENECDVIKKQLAEKQQELAEKQKALDAQKASFEKSYAELQHMAEELQKEGKIWRQRYLDLAYQVAP